jgi:hypothetical protein
MRSYSVCRHSSVVFRYDGRSHGFSRFRTSRNYIAKRGCERKISPRSKRPVLTYNIQNRTRFVKSQKANIQGIRTKNRRKLKNLRPTIRGYRMSPPISPGKSAYSQLHSQRDVGFRAIAAGGGILVGRTTVKLFSNLLIYMFLRTVLTIFATGRRPSP